MFIKSNNKYIIGTYYYVYLVTLTFLSTKIIIITKIKCFNY